MKKPLFLVIGGFAGAGKTTIARRLSKDDGLPLFSSDDFIEAACLTNKQDFHQVAPLAYDILWRVIDQQLTNSISLILDANMCHARTWEQLDRRAAQFPSYTILPLLLTCPLEVHKQRIAQRAIHEPQHTNLGGDTFEEILPKYEFIQSLNRTDIKKINANQPLDLAYQDVQKTMHDILQTPALIKKV